MAKQKFLSWVALAVIISVLALYFLVVFGGLGFPGEIFGWLIKIFIKIFLIAVIVEALVEIFLSKETKDKDGVNFFSPSIHFITFYRCYR